jgi:branched-chain amino acid aminotransferase
MSKKHGTVMPFAYFSGKVVPHSQAQVSIASHSLQYGTTCFAGIRGYMCDGVPQLFRLGDHHRRLMNACKLLGFDFSLTCEAFESILADLIQANSPTGDFYIRPFVYSPDQTLGPRFDGLSYELAIYLVPMSNYFDPSRGLNLGISSWRKFPDSSIPTKAKAGGAYLNSSLATTEAKANGFDEALLLDQEGYVVEASVANIILVYRGEVIIPPVGSAVLDGITLRTAIHLLREANIPIRFERIDRSMLPTCDELILTGTAAQYVFAASVDRRPIGDGTPGPICTLLRERFAALLSSKHPMSQQWLTAISLDPELV